MANVRLAGCGRLVAVLMVAAACAAPGQGSVASQTAMPPPATASVAPTPAATVTRAITQAPTAAPTLTPPMTPATATAAATAVTAGQAISIEQILGLSFIDSQQGWLLAAGACPGSA